MSASKSVCGVIEPGLESTWPRSTSVRFVPRSRAPALSPAWPWSKSLRNISTPVTTDFEADIYVLTKDEGGRHTRFLSGYRPQFYFRTTDVTGAISLPEGTDICLPGDRTSIGVSLIQPIAMDEGLRFAIREGGRTVGSGVVTEIIK